MNSNILSSVDYYTVISFLLLGFNLIIFVLYSPTGESGKNTITVLEKCHYCCVTGCMWCLRVSTMNVASKNVLHRDSVCADVVSNFST